MKTDQFAPARFSRYDALAIKAVAAGKASEGQQIRAMQWIIQAAARTYDETFVPGQSDLSDYLSGKRNVGLQLVKLINVPIDELNTTDKPERKS
jgi:hypothetical protein